jgi:hypothetical protein
VQTLEPSLVLEEPFSRLRVVHALSCHHWPDESKRLCRKKIFLRKLEEKLPNVNCLQPLIIFKVGFILFISFEKL